METGLWCKYDSEARIEQRREDEGKLRLDHRAARLARWWQAATGSGHEWHDCRGRSQCFSFVLYKESPRKAEERRERYGWWAAVRRGRGGDAAKRNRAAGGCVRSVARTPCGAGHSISPALRAAPRRQRAVLCTIEVQNARQSAYAGSSTMEDSVCFVMALRERGWARTWRRGADATAAATGDTCARAVGSRHCGIAVGAAHPHCCRVTSHSCGSMLAR